jgi:hypothetical protein
MFGLARRAIWPRSEDWPRSRSVCIHANLQMVNFDSHHPIQYLLAKAITHGGIIDESSFYYLTGHALIWLFPDGKVPDLERVRVQSGKVILIIACGPTRFATTVAIESWFKFNAGRDVNKMLKLLSE